MVSEDFFKHIETQFDNQLPFVVYRKPNEVEAKAILQNDDAIYKTSNFIEQGFVFSPFENIDDTVLTPLNISESISCNAVSLSAVEVSHNNEILKQSRKFSGQNDKQKHINLVEKGVEAIKNGTFKKVVLSRQEVVNISENNLISILKNLLNTYASAFVYCWYHPKIGLWLGATPETLIKIEGNRFSIMALAGTQDYKGTLEVNWQQKEKVEQQVVTDFIIENLESLVENVKVSKTETVKAGNLLHLKTNITAQLKSNLNLNEIITALHPTPAVCGYPKEVARQFILKNETYNREFYTGFLGELNFETTIAPRASKRNIENRAYTVKRKSTQLYVNLRCMQIKENNAIIYVGGGITESSNPESEWEETVSKSLVIKNVL